MTLYDITADMAELLRLHAEGEIDDQTLADTLDAGLKDDEAAKLEQYAYVYRSLDAEADMIRAEESRLRAKRVAKENAAERLRERVQAHLVSTGQTKGKAGLFSWSLRTSRAVAILDEGDLPMSVLRIKSEPDKTKIRELLDAGETVPGACIEERQSVVLK
jgi:hypothetical protein